MKQKMRVIGILIAAPLIIATLTFAKDPKPWPVPDKNSKMANPIKADAASVKEGKAVWTKDCASCHGKMGKGDGTKAAGLKTHPGDFSLGATQSQTDGSLFYKISEGREDMPSFKKKLPDAEDIWNVINYMRTFKQ